MATKNVGSLNWQTGVDLSGLRKDLKAAEGEMQKSASKAVKGTGGGITGGGGSGGRGLPPLIRKPQVAGGWMERLQGGLDDLEKATGIRGVGKLGGMLSKLGGMAPKLAPAAAMAAGYKGANMLADYGQGVRDDRMAARKYRMNYQDYAAMNGRMGMDEQGSAAMSGFAQGRRHLSNMGGMAWSGMKGAAASSFLTGMDFLGGGNINKALGGKNYTEMLADAGRKSEDDQRAAKKRIAMYQGLASGATARTNFEDGIGLGSALNEGKSLQRAAYWTEEAAKAQMDFNRKFGAPKTAEGPA